MKIENTNYEKGEVLLKCRRSSDEWFTIWNRIIDLEDTLSRRKLSKLSGASIQTIMKLQKDWISDTPITWNGDNFSITKQESVLSLSFFEKEEGK